jgi:hypothetical protein
VIFLVFFELWFFSAFWSELTSSLVDFGLGFSGFCGEIWGVLFADAEVLEDLR